MAVQSCRGRRDVAARDSTDSTKVLAQDEIGIASLQGRVVQFVKVEPGGESRANVFINFARGHRDIGERSNNDLAAVSDLCRPVALRRDAHEIVLEA